MSVGSRAAIVPRGRLHRPQQRPPNHEHLYALPGPPQWRMVLGGTTWTRGCPRVSPPVPRCPKVPVAKSTRNAVKGLYPSSPRGLFLIHWLQVQVLNDPPTTRKPKPPRFGLSAFVGVDWIWLAGAGRALRRVARSETSAAGQAMALLTSLARTLPPPALSGGRCRDPRRATGRFGRGRRGPNAGS